MKELIQKILATVTAFIWTLQAKTEEERGDVPGWVMITMMTAILVAALLVVAKDALLNMFNNAIGMIGQ
ncbi:hypothetical protein ACN08X_00040 [Rothia sp. P6271]|uniref:hypothetical protein n=1 Tax=unclassified Rothia (in: high G+C Gram-positive bacteria) TaxID=2689056 RepID=UPI003AC444CD